jgi:hypothetical protein
LLFELNAEPHFIFDCYFKLICARPMPEVWSRDTCMFPICFSMWMDKEKNLNNTKSDG